MNSRWSKRDSSGQVIHPGDVCVRIVRDDRNFNKGSLEYCVYKGEAWGGSGSKGEYGRFITSGGNRSIKYTSILFAFDPMGKRRASTEEIRELTKKFYEG